MKDGPRRRALLGLTIGVILWPIVHLGLVARAGIDAWELFGWAMYSRPEARVQVRVDVERDGTHEPLRAMGALRRQIERYARDRSTLGRLASPADLLEAVFASDPSIEAMELVRRRAGPPIPTSGRSAGSARRTTRWPRAYGAPDWSGRSAARGRARPRCPAPCVPRRGRRRARPSRPTCSRDS